MASRVIMAAIDQLIVFDSGGSRACYASHCTSYDYDPNRDDFYEHTGQFE